MIIGICGKSGSGKSTLSRELAREYKGVYLNIDKIGHEVLGIKEVQKELVRCFGNEVIESGKVDRKKLGDMVFNSRDEMKKLTGITWWYMEKLIDKFLNENKEKVIVLDWLLLPKTKYFNMCDVRILLEVPILIRMKRVLSRDNIDEKGFMLREKASIEYNKDDFEYVFDKCELDYIRKELVIK